MRIELFAIGGSSVSHMQTRLNTLHSNISATIQSMQSARQRIDRLPGGSQNLASAAQSLQKRIDSEQTKMDNVERLSQNVTTFISNTMQTDMRVATQIMQNQDQFIANNPWAGATASKVRSDWDRFLDRLKRELKTAGEWIKKAWDGIVTFVKEHAVEIIIGTVAIIVGAAIIALTGGTAAGFLAAFGSALLTGLKAAAVSALVSSAISGVIALFTGDNILESMGDGLASGFMWGGVFFALGTAFSNIRPLAKLKEKVTQFASQKIANLKSSISGRASSAWNSFSEKFPAFSKKLIGFKDYYSAKISFAKVYYKAKLDKFKANLNAIFKRSNIVDNANAIKYDYGFQTQDNNLYFGQAYKPSTPTKRNIVVKKDKNPIDEARAFFYRISQGGTTPKLELLEDKSGFRMVSRLKDGTLIIFRPITESSIKHGINPAVEISARVVARRVLLPKYQKIHFHW